MEALTESQWEYIREKIIKPMWFKSFQHTYEDVRLDYDDFESMCGFELSKAIQTFDASKSSLRTFIITVIRRKALMQIRDSKREKRKALLYAVSMDAPCDDLDVEIKDMIRDISAENQITNIEGVSDSATNVCNYLKEISSLQKSILICKLLDLEDSEIRNGLNISANKYNDLTKNMKRFEKEKHLRRVSDQ